MTRGPLGTSLDRWKVLEGRRFDPDKVDEVMLDYETARSLHLGVGDEMTLKFIRRASFDQQILSFLAGLPDRVAGTGTEGAIDQLPFPDEPEVTFHVVGIVTDPVTFPPIPGQLEPFLRLTPAFTERYGSDLTGNNVLFVDLADVTDLESFRSDVARLGGGAAVFFGLTQADHEANVNRTLHLAAVVLWLLAALIALAAFLVSIQALSRQAFFESSDHPVLRALGMTRRERFATGLVRTTVIALLATVVALVVAIALSPLWPIGLARVAEPSSGVEVNVAVIGIGMLAVFLGVLLTGAATAWRWTRPASHRHHRAHGTRPPLVARLLGGSLRPLPVVLGTRQALDGGRGRTAVPVRTTVMAAALAVATLTTALTFGASLEPPARHAAPLRMVVGRPDRWARVPRLRDRHDRRSRREPRRSRATRAGPSPRSRSTACAPRPSRWRPRAPAWRRPCSPDARRRTRTRSCSAPRPSVPRTRGSVTTCASSSATSRGSSRSSDARCSPTSVTSVSSDAAPTSPSTRSTASAAPPRTTWCW